MEPPINGAFCPQYHKAIELIGSRWTGAIVRCLLTGMTRFSEISAAVPGLSDRMLSERLKELEVEGVISREVTPSTPVRVEYVLTAKGRALAGVVSAVAAWAGEWVEAPGGASESSGQLVSQAAV